jgi:hypothetical protein
LLLSVKTPKIRHCQGSVVNWHSFDTDGLSRQQTAGTICTCTCSFLRPLHLPSLVSSIHPSLRGGLPACTLFFSFSPQTGQSLLINSLLASIIASSKHRLQQRDIIKAQFKLCLPSARHSSPHLNIHLLLTLSPRPQLAISPTPIHGNPPRPQLVTWLDLSTLSCLTRYHQVQYIIPQSSPAEARVDGARAYQDHILGLSPLSNDLFPSSLYRSTNYSVDSPRTAFWLV